MSKTTQPDCVQFLDAGIKLGDAWVLKNLNVSVPPKKITGIIGASGSGKTTILQLILGIHRPTSGRVLVQGEPIPHENIEKYRRRIGYAVQSAGLLPHMSVFKNVSLIARLEGWSGAAIEERVNYLFELMDLPMDLGTRYPYELSSGQQHRAGFCRAMMLNPDMYLLDEPFSTIDPVTRLDIQLHFKRIHRELNFSTLLVTHDMREAQLLCDYLVVVGNQGIVQHGLTTEVVDNPEHEVVRRLLASIR